MVLGFRKRSHTHSVLQAKLCIFASRSPYPQMLFQMFRLLFSGSWSSAAVTTNHISGVASHFQTRLASQIASHCATGRYTRSDGPTSNHQECQRQSKPEFNTIIIINIFDSANRMQLPTTFLVGPSGVRTGLLHYYGQGSRTRFGPVRWYFLDRVVAPTIFVTVYYNNMPSSQQGEPCRFSLLHRDELARLRESFPNDGFMVGGDWNLDEDGICNPQVLK